MTQAHIHTDTQTHKQTDTHTHTLENRGAGTGKRIEPASPSSLPFAGAILLPTEVMAPTLGPLNVVLMFSALSKQNFYLGKYGMKPTLDTCLQPTVSSFFLPLKKD